MQTLKNLISKLIRSINGATAIEYGLIAALIAVASTAAMSTLGSEVGASFNATSSKLASSA